jgi:hypothetical protein
MENLGKKRNGTTNNDNNSKNPEECIFDGMTGKTSPDADYREKQTSDLPKKRGVIISCGEPEIGEKYNFVDMIQKRYLDSDDLEKAMSENPDCENESLEYRPDNYLHHLHAMAIEGPYCLSVSARSGVGMMNLDYGNETYGKFWALLIAFLESYRISGRKVFGREGRHFSQFVQMSSDTYSSLIAVFSSITHELLEPEFVARISVNPFESPVNRLDVRRIIEEGNVVIYNPVKISMSIGKVLKAGFFRALLTPERLNNPSVPPFFYICDEFQRFITHDEDSGEQSFLDRCRAYRVCCALATQSIASLRYVFDDERGNHSINIIINNTGTKLFFRTTDSNTVNTLTDLIPHPVNQEKPHVVRVRPPTTLQTGECYYILANGMTGRGQVRI